MPPQDSNRVVTQQISCHAIYVERMVDAKCAPKKQVGVISSPEALICRSAIFHVSLDGEYWCFLTRVHENNCLATAWRKNATKAK